MSGEAPWRNAVPHAARRSSASAYKTTECAPTSLSTTKFINLATPERSSPRTATDATVSFVGTLGYVPPEGPGLPQADLYSLGKVLYEASTGKERHEFPEPLTELGTNEDWEAQAELNEVVLKACAPSLSERYESAEAMRRLADDPVCLIVQLFDADRFHRAKLTDRTVRRQ